MKTNQKEVVRHCEHKLIIRLLLSLFALLALNFGTYANAATVNNNSCIAITMPTTFTLPSTISIGRDVPVYTLLGSAVSQTYSFECNSPTYTNNYIQFRGIPTGAVAYSGGGVIFPTNIVGVGILVTSNTGSITGSSSDLIPKLPNNTIETVTITAQYIKTATIATGTSTINAMSMFNIDWVVLGYNNSQVFGAVSTASSTSITAIACTVSAGSANLTVTLPSVNTTAFTGLQSTAGTTPFNLSLSCSSGTTVKITMAATNASSTYTGVVSPTSGTGYATGVGVQLFDVTNNTAVTFGNLATIGASPSSTMTIPYKAQYFQTASAVTAGNVSATVTFTMTYQ